MNILIILGHPDKNSFNHAIANTCKDWLLRNGHNVILHDLYKEGFDPVTKTSEIPKNGLIDTEIAKHCSELTNSDGIIIVHPNWWGQPPAILKGWIDRVMRPGIAYKFNDGDNGEGIPIGLLKAKAGIVFNTSNTSEERENNMFKDPLETIWRNCVFDFCGVKHFYRKTFRIMITSSLEQRTEWLNQVVETMDHYFQQNNGIGICTANDTSAINEIINDAAIAYKGIIPGDRFHEPYMPMDELETQIKEGVEFWGYRKGGLLIGVMGIQDRGEVSLIRHAYVRTTERNKGIGKKLLKHLTKSTNKPVLIGTWADAIWAIGFYEKNGFKKLTHAEKEVLLRKYWSIPERQVETSVVLADENYFENF